MSDYNISIDKTLLDECDDNGIDPVDQLIIKYRYLVEAISTKYINSILEIEDTIQEGMIGLFAAIKSYKSDKGTKFTTYASRCINNSINNAISKQSRLKDIPQDNVIVLEEDQIGSQQSLSAEDEFLAIESVNGLNNILYEELSKFENEVLRLHIIGLTYNDIANKLQKKPKAIDNAIQRIRKKLNGVTF